MLIWNFINTRIASGEMGLDTVSPEGMTLTVNDGKTVHSLFLKPNECEMVSAYWERNKIKNAPKVRKKIIAGKSADDFIEFLELTLIPDLKESGTKLIAKDLETAIKWIKHFKGDV